MSHARRLVWWTIGIGTAVRIIIAAITGLGVDESYAVACARQLQLSYFDHPPLSFWLVHFVARVFGSEAHLVVRAPFILLFAATTWLMFRLTADVFGEHEGWLAVLFLTVCPVFSFSTGTWVLPDGPLMCALVGSAYCLARVLLHPAGERGAFGWWLGAGVWLGLALLSKYQAFLFLAGVALFLVVRPAQRRWLWRAEPYAGLAIALAMFTPVLVWNAQHGWASFAFQLGRQGADGHATVLQRIGSLGQTIAGQALWVLPWLWVPLVWVMGRAFLRRPSEDRLELFACLGVVPIGVFTLVALSGRPALPHWPASGYVCLFPLLGAAIVARASSIVDRRNPARRATPPGTERRRGGPDRRLRPLAAWSLWSIGSYAVLTVLATSALVTGWHAHLLPQAVRGRDPILEAADWNGLARGLDSLGMLGRQHTFVAATSWVQAGKVAYALGPGVPVLCLSVDPRQFAFLHDQRDFIGQDAVIVDRLPARYDINARYDGFFTSLTPVGTVTIRRGRAAIFDVGVYLAHNFIRPFPATAMPAGALAAIPRDEMADYLPPDPTQDGPIVEQAR